MACYGVLWRAMAYDGRWSLLRLKHSQSATADRKDAVVVVVVVSLKHSQSAAADRKGAVICCRLFVVDALLSLYLSVRPSVGP